MGKYILSSFFPLHIMTRRHVEGIDVIYLLMLQQLFLAVISIIIQVRWHDSLLLYKKMLL